MKPQRYQIIILNSLDNSWTTYFTGMNIAAGPVGVTRLCGEIADQSALHGLLNKIRDLNLKIISVQLLDNNGITPVECLHCPLNKPPAGKNKPLNTSLDG
jgi:hypothetical protein